MRRVGQFGGVVAAVTAMLVATGGGAFADPGDTTHVDEVAAADGDLISVTGQATFVDLPAQVGEDPAGDATVSGAAGGQAPVGDDLTTATIARPDAFANELRFTLGIANQPPELNGTPEVIHYNWDISVDGGSPLTLQAIRTAQFASPGAEPVFRLLNCAEGSCATVAELSGTMADGEVTWQVPMSQINAVAGSVIAQGGNVVSTLGASGAVWFVNLGGDQMFVVDYTVPGPTVQLGIAPAGTPAASVPLTASATVEPTGAFAGTLSTPDTPGDYIVVAKACNGPDNCGLATTTLSV